MCFIENAEIILVEYISSIKLKYTKAHLKLLSGLLKLIKRIEIYYIAFAINNKSLQTPSN